MTEMEMEMQLTLERPRLAQHKYQDHCYLVDQGQKSEIYNKYLYFTKPMQKDFVEEQEQEMVQMAYEIEKQKSLGLKRVIGTANLASPQEDTGFKCEDNVWEDVRNDSVFSVDLAKVMRDGFIVASSVGEVANPLYRIYPILDNAAAEKVVASRASTVQVFKGDATRVDGIKGKVEAAINSVEAAGVSASKISENLKTMSYENAATLKVTAGKSKIFSPQAKAVMTTMVESITRNKDKKDVDILLVGSKASQLWNEAQEALTSVVENLVVVTVRGEIVKDLDLIPLQTYISGLLYELDMPDNFVLVMEHCREIQVKLLYETGFIERKLRAHGRRVQVAVLQRSVAILGSTPTLSKPPPYLAERKSNIPRKPVGMSRNEVERKEVVKLNLAAATAAFTSAAGFGAGPSNSASEETTSAMGFENVGQEMKPVVLQPTSTSNLANQALGKKATNSMQADETKSDRFQDGDCTNRCLNFFGISSAAELNGEGEENHRGCGFLDFMCECLVQVAATCF